MSDDDPVVIDIADTQWNGIVRGHLVGPNRTSFVRRTTRTVRREADLLIGAGAPLVVYHYGAGQLDWHDGEDAAAKWSQLRGDLSSQPYAQSRNGGTIWTAGRWESSSGQPLLILTGRC